MDAQRKLVLQHMNSYQSHAAAEYSAMTIRSRTISQVGYGSAYVAEARPAGREHDISGTGNRAGWIKKRGHRMGSVMWKKRWIEVDHTLQILRYYDNEGGRLLGSVSLQVCDYNYEVDV